MPHYVLQLDESAGDYAVYSTIVDNLITPVMSASDMRSHLESNGYETWLTPYDAEKVIADWWADGSDSMKQLMRDQARYFYFNQEHGFGYAKESDSYFCLPRELWRNE